MPEQDGRDLLALNRGLEAWANILKDALEDERARADTLMERMTAFLEASEKERGEWKAFAKKEYERGYQEGYARGRHGFGVFAGVNYTGELAAGVGYTVRF